MISKSIAILPFLNLSFGSQLEYFRNSIREENFNVLELAGNLKLFSRLLSFYFKKKNMLPKKAKFILSGIIFNIILEDLLKETAKIFSERKWEMVLDRQFFLAKVGSAYTYIEKD